MLDTFPKKFLECPICGSKNRLVEDQVNSEITAGKLSGDTRMPAIAIQRAIFNPNDKTSLIVASRNVPVLVMMMDVCSDCGCFYCIEAHKTQALITPQMRTPDNQDPLAG